MTQMNQNGSSKRVLRRNAILYGIRYENGKFHVKLTNINKLLKRLSLLDSSAWFGESGRQATIIGRLVVLISKLVRGEEKSLNIC